MDRTNLTQLPGTRKLWLHCPACGANLRPPTPHSCGRGATEKRIASALERAGQRGHYAQYVGTSRRLQAQVFFVKSSSRPTGGYTVYVFHNEWEGTFAYLPGLYARCECLAAQKGYPCDHGAKGARAAGRRESERPGDGSMTEQAA
jgi:hypothetical protein